MLYLNLTKINQLTQCGEFNRFFKADIIIRLGLGRKDTTFLTRRGTFKSFNDRLSKHFGSILPTWFLDGRSMPTGASKAKPFMGKGLHKIFNSFKPSDQKIKIQSQSNPKHSHSCGYFLFVWWITLDERCFISSWTLWNTEWVVR